MADNEIAKLIIALEAKLTEFTAQMQAGSAQVKQFADKSKADLGSLDGVFASLKSHWVSITATIGAVVGAYKTVTSSVDSMKELGTQTLSLMRMTQMTSKESSTMIAVAHELGISYETLSGSVVNIMRRMGALKDIESMTFDETGKSVDVFKKFGIEVKDAEGKVRPFPVIFEEIRKAIQRSSEPMATATQFFRYSAKEMLPLLTMSKEEIARLSEEAEKMGLVLGSKNVNDVRNYVLAQHSLQEAITSVKLVIGQELIPVLTESTKALGENIKQVRAFVNEYRSLLSLPWEILKFIKDNWVLLLAAMTPIVTLAMAPVIASWIAALGGLGVGLALTTGQVTALAAAVGLLLGYQLGQWIDAFVFKLSGGKIDISGINRLAEGLNRVRDVGDETANKLQKLGFIGPNAMKEFTNAVNAGTVIWDAAAQKWVKTASDMEAPNPKLEAAIDKVVKKTEELQIELTKMSDPAAASAMALELFVSEATKNVEVSDKLATSILGLRAAFAALKVEETKKVIAKEAEEYAKSWGIALDERQALLDQAAVAVAEDQKKINQTMKENQEKLYESEAIAIQKNYDELVKRRQEAEDRAQKAREMESKMAEIAIQGELKRVAIAEKRLEISPLEAVNREISLNEQLLKIENDRAAILDRDSAAYAESQKHLESIRDRLVDLVARQRELGTDWAVGIVDGLKKVSWEISNYRLGMMAAQGTIGAVGGTFKSVFVDTMMGDLKTFGDYWRAFWREIFNVFGSVVDAMVKKWVADWLAAQAQTGGGFGQLLQFLGFGGGGVGVGGIAPYGGGFGTPPVGTAVIAHSGGIIGETSFPMRNVVSSIFRNAPRLHSGLSPDEYPAILQAGERVIPSGQAGGAPNVTINLQNQSGVPLTGKQGTMNFDGKAWVVSIVLENLNTGGDLRKAMMAIGNR